MKQNKKIVMIVMKELTMDLFLKFTAPPKQIMLNQTIGIGTPFPCFLVVQIEGGIPPFRTPCSIETGSSVFLDGFDGPRKVIQLRIPGLLSPEALDTRHAKSKEESIAIRMSPEFDDQPKFGNLEPYRFSTPFPFSHESTLSKIWKGVSRPWQGSLALRSRVLFKLSSKA